MNSAYTETDVDTRISSTRHGVIPFINQRAKTDTYETRYTFSGKERDEETGYSYFGARYYNSALSIWLSVDPMADKYPGVSPYTYCANNPVKLVDPDGRDWVEREYKGTKEVYYDRTVKSQADVDKKYGANSGVRHLADGSGVGNDKYTVYNDSEKNKYGYIINNATGKIVNNDRTVIEDNGYIIYAGVTEESLDASTLHNNYMGTSYTGPNNPKCYNGTDCYDYNPTNLSEFFSKTHDLQYNDLNAKGIKGALLQTNTWKADMQLSISNAVSIPFNPDPKDRMRSAATAVAFGFIGTYKMAANFAKKTWNTLFGR